MTLRVLLFLLAITLLSGCGEPAKHYTRDGKSYGVSSGTFRGRWWNYYERGRSFSDGRFFSEAIADFSSAIKGRGEDKWRARTYGMHFVDYFPHRELGVVYYQQKQYPLSIAELERSLASAPSAKARFFLNKARAAQLREEDRDQSPPEVSIDGVMGSRLTNSFTQIIKGVAVDDTYVATVRVGDKTLPIELARKKQLFSLEVPLEAGKNIIRVEAVDLLGKSSHQDLEIISDRTGPLVEILEMKNTAKGVIVHGVVSDDGGLRSLYVNNDPWNISGHFLAYNFKFPLPPEGLVLTAVDKAGNVTRAHIREEDQQQDPLLTAGLANTVSRAGSGDSRVISDSHSPALAAAAKMVTDEEPPFIKLKGLDDQRETYDDSLLLEGYAADLSPIHSLQINGEPVQVRGGKKIYFTWLGRLEQGVNGLRITAIDSQGNRGEKRITIERKIQQIRQVGTRMSVAIFPFEVKGEPSPRADLVYDQLIDSLLRQKRFNVVERAKIDAVLAELKLSSTSLVDPDQAADLGRIVAAGAILAGTVVESADSFEIIGRLIDTETATILASNDIYGEDKSFAGLGTLLDSLAFKFKRDFPLFEGILIEVRGGHEVLIDIGTEQKIRPNLHFLCYRDGLQIKHPVTGRLLGAEPEILGELTITEVFDGFSKASLDAKTDVKVYDRVIAR